MLQWLARGASCSIARGSGNGLNVMLEREGYLAAADGTRLYFQTLGDTSSDAPQVLVMPNGAYLLDDFGWLAQQRTLIVYDLRNRGRSDAVTDAARLKRGVLHDVEDLEAVCRHFALDAVDLFAHSYAATMIALFAMQSPGRVRRAIQIGPTPPDYGAQYPAHLVHADEVLADVFAKLGALQAERATMEPRRFCERAWLELRRIYVVDEANAHRADWGRCELANERGFMQHWMQNIVPSLQALSLTSADYARASMPFLVVHGRKDRSSPYGGGLDWARRLPDARIVTVDDAAHAPWIEAPRLVFDAIAAFLRGEWPREAT
jgi:proline iminopeptidase